MGAYRRKKVEYVIVGSGPGGATVARELAKAGKDVLLLEKGRDHRGKWYYGTHLGGMIYCEKKGFLFTEEGYRVIQGTMTGGSTNLFCGCASPPPVWLKERYGVDLDPLVNETIAELNIAPLPRPLWGLATQRIEEAGLEMGYDWTPQPKFIDPGNGAPFDCGAKCMLGCRCGAKWTANDYLDDAVRSGCGLITGATVKEVLVSNGKAAGVVATLSGGTEVLKVEAGTVILAAGGIGTPIILQHTGISEAGHGMVMDTTAIVYGQGRNEGMAYDAPMAVSCFDDENGYMLSTLLDPWMMYAFNLPAKGVTNPGRLLGYGKTMGIMIKLKDEISGGISMEGKISKPLTDADRRRLNHASLICRKILIRAGCRPDSIFMGPPMGTHPSGTVRIGELLTGRLETSIESLYVSDASCFPEALDRPTVLTLIALSKRLARHLVGKGEESPLQEERTEPPPPSVDTETAKADPGPKPEAKSAGKPAKKAAPQRDRQVTKKKKTAKKAPAGSKAERSAATVSKVGSEQGAGKADPLPVGETSASLGPSKRINLLGV